MTITVIKYAHGQGKDMFDPKVASLMAEIGSAYLNTSNSDYNIPGYETSL